MKLTFTDTAGKVHKIKFPHEGQRVRNDNQFDYGFWDTI